MKRKLRIEFRHMMVFYGRAEGMTVLLPELGHKATVKQTAGPCQHPPPLLTQCLIEIVVDGAPITGRGPVVCDRGEYLVHAREALGPDGDVPPRSDLLQGAVPPELNARIELPGPGRLEALEGECENYPPAANARWDFERLDGKTHTQRLSDRIVYTLPFSDTENYGLRVTNKDGQKWTYWFSGGTNFVISNADGPGAPSHGPFNELTQFTELYRLLALPRQPVPRPLPAPTSKDLPVKNPHSGDRPRTDTPDVACCDPLICGETHETKPLERTA